ncbi:MAG: IS5 family transposase [Flavobacteriales bacterium]
MRRYEITPSQWLEIEFLFPAKKGKRGRPIRSHYEIFNGILWVLFSGASWRDVPERYGPWKTVYDRFNKWSKDDTIDKVLSHLHLKLDEGGLLDYSKWMVDSTTARAHKSAAGGSKKNR